MAGPIPTIAVIDAVMDTILTVVTEDDVHIMPIVLDVPMVRRLPMGGQEVNVTLLVDAEDIITMVVVELVHRVVINRMRLIDME